jgi:hypothetical protein
VGLEKDLSARLLNDLGLLGRNGGDGDLERMFRRDIRTRGDPAPRALRYCGEATIPFMTSAAVSVMVSM